MRFKGIVFRQNLNMPWETKNSIPLSMKLVSESLTGLENARNNIGTIAPEINYKIAYCLPVFRPPGTSDTSILLQMLIMEKLKARGHSLSLIAPKDLPDVICAKEWDDSKLANRTWSKSMGFTLASKTAWRLQRWLGIPYLNVFSNLSLYDACLQCLPSHDLVQERIGLYKHGVAMACRRLGLPYIVFFDSDEILEHDLFGTPLKGILRWRAVQAIRYNLATAARILCVSKSAQAHLAKVWQVAPDKTVVFSNAVDVNHFRPRPELGKEVRARWGFADHPLIIFVGSFFPYQDVKGLLDAYARVLVKHPQVRLLLVGEGEQYAETVQYANDLGLANVVKFTGFLPHSEIPAIMSAADIAVAPYTKIEDEKFLGSSMKLVEYMAAGVPVIASDNGQIREVIQDGVNGFLVPAGDIHALGDTLLKLIEHPHLRQSVGQQARQTALHEYSWDVYISRLENLYASVLEERSQQRSR
jgi:glycosyltransferase involved in cell wall biosynthesis